MKWKRILKAPLPINSREARDKNYKEAIIAYESKTIETKLGEFIGQRPALEKLPIYIGFTENASNHEKVNERKDEFVYFTIHLESVPQLGMNRHFIINTISDLYSKEGYEVVNDTLNGMGAVKIRQP